MKFKAIPKQEKAAKATLTTGPNGPAADGNVKLTKQERRNRNKQLKATNTLDTRTVAPSTKNESVYKRETIYPTSLPSFPGPWDRFITPQDASFEQVLHTSYDGFVVSGKDKFPKQFHDNFRAAMEGLDAEGYYQYDVTQPAGLGTKLAKTFVTRCLVGDAGTTYKYLGLRMFSIPWDDSNDSVFAQQLQEINQTMIQHTTKLLKSSGKEKVGSCQYNLTLINKCFPADQGGLKNEPSFEQDKCSVSWHADSTLEHFSTIGVYHCTSATDPVKAKAGVAAESKDVDASWRIALRVWYDAEGPNATRALSSRAGEMSSGARIAPAVAVPLPSGSAYFLLDDFNHHHQHAVLAGQTYRYASTHRVCKTEGHTFQTVRAKCQRLLQVPAGSPQQFTSRTIRAELLAQTEIEFEWLRQFYIQGQHHYDLHVWWHGPMQELLRLWGEFQARLQGTLETLRAASAFDYNSEPAESAGSVEARKARKRWWKLRKRIESVDAACFEAAVEVLKERHEKRAGWAARERDPIFSSLGKGHAPVPCPILETLCSTGASTSGAAVGAVEGAAQLPRVTSLLNLAQCVDQWKKAFLQNLEHRK